MEELKQKVEDSTQKVEESKQKPEVEPSYTDADTAGAWTRCINDLKAHDEASVKAWKEEIDTLLVFAGLFSGVLTAFSVQSYTLLQPNPGPDATVQLLAQISAQLASFHVGGGFINSTIDSNSTPPPVGILAESVSSSSIRINVLWFSSLICSLSAASICILVKQWLNQYSTELSGVSQRAAWTRQYRNDCMKQWHVHNIIMLLPILLQSALGLFLAGLLDLLWTLHRTVASVATVFVAILALFQLSTTILPAFVQGCPYQSPQSLVFYIFVQFCKIPYRFGAGDELQMYTWRDREQTIVKERTPFLELGMLATADHTFMDDTFLDAVIRPCSYSIDWSSQETKIQWFHDVVNHRTSRFHAGDPDALANLALDTVLKPRKMPLGNSHIDGLLFSCLNNATPEWWQAHSPHSQRLFTLAAAVYRRSNSAYHEAFNIISNIRTHGAQHVSLQRDHVDVIIDHVQLCHEKGDMDVFLAATDVLMHYASEPTNVPDNVLAQMQVGFADVLHLVRRFYQSQVQYQETHSARWTAKLLKLIPPILRVAKRSPSVVPRDFVEMLIGFPSNKGSVSDPQQTRALLKSASCDANTIENYLSEVDAIRSWLVRAGAPQVVDQVIHASGTTTLVNTGTTAPSAAFLRHSIGS